MHAEAPRKNQDANRLVPPVQCNGALPALHLRHTGVQVSGRWPRAVQSGDYNTQAPEAWHAEKYKCMVGLWQHCMSI